MANAIKTTFLLTFIAIIGLSIYGGLALEEDCYTSNVEKLYLRGEVYTYDDCDPQGEEICYNTASEDLLDLLDAANEDEYIKAIWLEIDSTGGEAAAAEEIARKIQLIDKPVISSVRANANSAAYWIASVTDYIFALSTSDVGSIGVTMSYTDHSEKNKKEGITFNEVTSAKYKSVLDENKPLTEEERIFIGEVIQSTHDDFIEGVAKGRNLSLETVQSLADGRFWTGKQALELQLIDQIGSEDDVVQYIQELIGEEVDVCE